MRTHRFLMVQFIAAAFVAVTAACGNSDNAKPSGGAASGGPQNLTIAMSELKFEPTALTVQAGRPVQLTIKNKGTTRHDFVIAGMPATGVKNDIDEHGAMVQPGMVMGDAQPGREAKVAFTPTEKGEYEIYCSVTGHKDAGMTGMLRVQ